MKSINSRNTDGKITDGNNLESSIKVGKKAFLLGAVILVILIIVSGILTIVLPAGEYQRIEGSPLVVEDSYQEIDSPDYPVWRWFTAPVEILYGPDNLTLIVLIIFIITVSGSITILENAGVMKALINFLVARFAKRKYFLIVVLISFFMIVSSFVGIYEGMVPLVIFIIPIAISLGWDSLTGLGMSLLPLAFGFAAAVTNPLTVAIAQRIAGLPLFSGSLLRIIFLVVIFCLTCFFVIRHAKKVEKKPQSSICYSEDEALRKRLLNNENALALDIKDTINRGQWKALIWFAVWIALAMIMVVVTARIPGLSDLAFPLMTVFFLIGGIGSGIFSGNSGKEIGRTFVRGAWNIFPGIVLLLLAYSVKHIITTGKIIDTILYIAAEYISRSPPMAAAFLVYAVTLVMEFFIGSASAKAFLMMPILTPLAEMVGITRQTAVLAFNFGDGFSNVFFPTNPLLLIALSFSVISFGKWIRWTWKIQLVILVITSVFLAVAVKIGYGP